jgi:hypothetical protein
VDYIHLIGNHPLFLCIDCQYFLCSSGLYTCGRESPVSMYRLSIFIPLLPEGGGGYTVLRLSVLPSVQDIFRRIFLSNCWLQKSDIWSQASYRYTILWVAFLDPSDSYFLFADLVGFYAHWTYMHIFRHIFLSNYWWQRSDIWSQVSYRYPISWEAFLDPSDSYFLFANFVDFYTHWTYILYMPIFNRIILSNYWWQKSGIWSQASYRYPISREAFFDPSDSYFLFAEEWGYHKRALAHSSSCSYMEEMLCSRLTEVWIRQIYILCFQVDKFKGKSIDNVFERIYTIKNISLLCILFGHRKKSYERTNRLLDLIWFIVFNATFSNISAISWRPVLVVEEARVPGVNHRPWASNR